MPRIFISYRRADSAQAAGRLRDALARRYGAGNVFLDEHSIRAGADFPDEIRTAVARCDLVLVLIGERWLGEERPRIHDASDWVRAEVELALRSQRRVIPVLVNNATMPAAAALPESLRPLVHKNAARLRPGRDTEHDLAHLQRMIGRNWRRTAAVGCGVGVAAAAATWLLWPAAGTPQIREVYCANMAFSLTNKVVCVGKLERQVYERRHSYIRLRYRGDTLVSYALMNAAGEPLNEIRVQEAENGSVVIDRTGRVGGKLYAAGGLTDIRTLMPNGPPAYKTARAKDPDTPNAVLVTYENSHRGLARNKRGVFGQRELLSPKFPLPTRIEYLDAKKQPLSDRWGVRSVELTYNELGDVTRRTYLDMKRQPTTNERGCAIEEFVRSKPVGNLLEQRCTDKTGSAVINIQGCTIVKYEYDDSGNRIAEHCLGPEREGVQQRDGCVSHTYRYNNRGEMIATTCLNAAGTEIYDSGRCVTQTVEYDRARRAVSTSCYGADAQLTPWAPRNSNNALAGCAVRVVEYSADGRVETTRCVDTNVEPTLSRFDVAAVRKTHARRITRVEFLGLNGEATTHRATGIHRMETEYDKQGRISARRFFDAAGRTLRPRGQ